MATKMIHYRSQTGEFLAICRYYHKFKYYLLTFCSSLQLYLLAWLQPAHVSQCCHFLQRDARVAAQFSTNHVGFHSYLHFFNFIPPLLFFDVPYYLHFFVFVFLYSFFTNRTKIEHHPLGRVGSLVDCPAFNANIEICWTCSLPL